MLTRRLISRSFCKYNILKPITNLLKAPRKHLKAQFEAEGIDNQTWGNQTVDAFDEVSQEWQAAIVQNTYDQHTQQYLDNHTQPNFGTVDNPHVIVTSDAPFRYVGCSGQPNEDDYEGHEFLVMMLREGPLQRCMSCGQVYKLVRLRNEFSEEMDYYKSSTIPLDHFELGQADHWHQFNPLRLASPTWEHTHFEQKSNNVYSLVNIDDHDRILVDPAYRLEKLRIMEEKTQMAAYSFHLLDQHYTSINPDPISPVNPVDYENLHEAEQSISRIDRVLKRSARYSARQFLDTENHDRREIRMRERSSGRVIDSYTIYFGGLSEDEAKYRDYFETDLENNPDDEALSENQERNNIMDKSYMRLENFDFQEMYTAAAQEDAQSSLNKKLFEFKYRRAANSPEDYNRREERLFNRTLDRFSQAEYKQVFNNLSTAKSNNDRAAVQNAESDILRLFAVEGLKQFKDYYETDSDEINL